MDSLIQLIAIKLGQICYYGTNLRRISEHFYSNKFTSRDRKKLVSFLKNGLEVEYKYKNLFKKVTNFKDEKVIGGHLIIDTFMIQQMKINLSKHFLLIEYHLTSSDTIGELEFFMDQLKIVIKNNLPKGFVLGWSQVYNKNGKILKQDIINKCFVDNFKEYNLPIIYIDYIKSPVKISL